MNKFMVDSINELSEIYNSIKKRVTNTKKLLESDRMFIKFYHDFINGAFNVNERSNNGITKIKSKNTNE